MNGRNRKRFWNFIWALSRNNRRRIYLDAPLCSCYVLVMTDYDKRQWQDEQAARDAALEIQKVKWAKAKERAARNAQRKIDRLARKLSAEGMLTDWEEEFTGSVAERLDKFGSAFQDPEKGRPADALSFAQKKVVAALNKKAKDAKKDINKDSGKIDKVSRETKPRKSMSAKKGFKKKAGFQPRVRDIHEDLDVIDSEPFIPEISKTDSNPPFLRIVK